MSKLKKLYKSLLALPPASEAAALPPNVDGQDILACNPASRGQEVGNVPIHAPVEDAVYSFTYSAPRSRPPRRASIQKIQRMVVVSVWRDLWGWLSLSPREVKEPTIGEKYIQPTQEYFCLALRAAGPAASVAPRSGPRGERQGGPRGAPPCYDNYFNRMSMELLRYF
ncbi:hypothetical protein B0H16DRAFT_1465366 [Mycena metata]|uniref:Uncharacterized protein n=1 Tax=Mycena metata TaxID=1033252 RepID=A0AAD7IBH9_9AGAR|nr:hypothetical protein B0H16DRAFT_1465366 [Mycena metata]